MLDANVLVQASVRDTLLRLAERDVYRPLWSAEIMEEVERTLTNKMGVAADKCKRLASVLREHFPDAWVEDHQTLIPRLRNHPKDRHVLAAAITGRAHVIVTYNLRDFPPQALRGWEVRAIGPSTFLKHLYSAAPAVMMETLGKQAADIQRSLPQQLMTLSLAVPAFVEEIRRLENVPIR